MQELALMKPEARYGLPEADQILFNRHYTVGFSYYFRQAKWALEIVYGLCFKFTFLIEIWRVS